MTQEATQASRYSWVIVATLTLLLGATHGLISSGISVFDPAILAELQITRGALKLRDLVQLFSAGIWALLIGFAASRVGPRTIINTGLILLMVVLWLYSHVTSVQQIYWLHLFLAFCYSSCHVVVVLLILTRWFTTRRNTALGIILAGESLGGAIFPHIVVKLVAAIGWREAMEWLSILPLVLMVMTLVLMRESPQKMGRMPYGWCGNAAEVSGSTQATSPGVAREGFWAQLMRWEVMAVIFTAGLIFYVGGGVAAHTFLYFRDKGLDPSSAAAGLSLFFAAAFIGKFASGFLSEWKGVVNVWLMFQFVMLLGVVAITFDADGFAYGIIACVGLGWGGCYTLSQALMMERFQGAYLARLSGITVLVEGLTAGLGSFVSGMLFDQYGSYTVAFSVMCGLLLLSIASSLAIRRTKQPSAFSPLIQPNADVA